MTNPVGAQVWSQTAANNATADGSINWAEGMPSSQVNDSARAEMASMAKFISDNNGSIVTSGSSIAFTATTNQVESALTAGYTIAIQFHATPDSSATIAVDSLAAKPLQVVSGVNLKGGEYLAGSIVRFTYSTTGTGQWIANCAEVAVPGFTNNSNANAGLVGEYQSTLVTSGSAVVLASGVVSNVTSLPLTAGDWDLWGEVYYRGTGSITFMAGAISQTIAETTATASALPADGFDYDQRKIPADTAGAGVPYSIAGLRTRATSSSSVTYYLNTFATISGTVAAYGALRARRVR